MCCKFNEQCWNAETEACHVCKYNPKSCTRDFFEWNEEGKEPTKDKLKQYLNKFKNN